MEKVITFIVDHWRLIADVCAALFCLVMFLLRKRPIDVVDGLYSSLNKVVPGFITYAESKYGAGKGTEKLDCVVDLAVAYINKLYPGLSDLSDYIEYVKNQVEVILSTPQKKGE
jgi:hypothetical protein